MATIEDLCKITAWYWPEDAASGFYQRNYFSRDKAARSISFFRFNVNDVSAFRCTGLRNPQKAKHASIMKSLRKHFPSLKVKVNGGSVIVLVTAKDEAILKLFFKE